MLKDISVCVNDIHERDNALRCACELAKSHTGTLTALYIKYDALEIIRWQGSSSADLANQLIEDQEKREQSAKKVFGLFSKEFDCETRWKSIYQSPNPIHQMLFTDVLLIDQPSNDGTSYKNERSFLNNLILQSKRPVIMIPTDWHEKKIATEVLVGWDSSAEAMRAASDALPILQSADKVKILSIQTEKNLQANEHNAYCLQEYFARKKIDASLEIQHLLPHSNYAEHLGQYAQQNNTDLIVVGAYGHSRLKEVIMGGTTNRLIKQATVPVLFSH